MQDINFIVVQLLNYSIADYTISHVEIPHKNPECQGFKSGDIFALFAKIYYSSLAHSG